MPGLLCFVPWMIIMSGASFTILVESFVTLSGRGVRATLPCRSVGWRGGCSFMENMMIRSVGLRSGLRWETQECGGECFSIEYLALEFSKFLRMYPLRIYAFIY